MGMFLFFFHFTWFDHCPIASQSRPESELQRTHRDHNMHAVGNSRNVKLPVQGYCLQAIRGDREGGKLSWARSLNGTSHVNNTSVVFLWLVGWNVYIHHVRSFLHHFKGPRSNIPDLHRDGSPRCLQSFLYYAT